MEPGASSPQQPARPEKATQEQFGLKLGGVRFVFDFPIVTLTILAFLAILFVSLRASVVGLPLPDPRNPRSPVPACRGSAVSFWPPICGDHARSPSNFYYARCRFWYCHTSYG